jgi:hypothetical protein
MFFAASAEGYRPLELSGVGVSDNVLQLQQALRELAILTGRDDLNPGPLIGQISPLTVTAIQNSLDLLYGQLPQQVQHEIYRTVKHDRLSTELKNIIGRHAGLLANAVKNAASQIASARAAQLQGLANGTDFFAPGWTSDTSKLAIVGGGALALVAATIAIFHRGKRSKR